MTRRTADLKRRIKTIQTIKLSASNRNLKLPKRNLWICLACIRDEKDTTNYFLGIRNQQFNTLVFVNTSSLDQTLCFQLNKSRCPSMVRLIDPNISSAHSACACVRVMRVQLKCCSQTQLKLSIAKTGTRKPEQTRRLSKLRHWVLSESFASWMVEGLLKEASVEFCMS